MNTKRTKFLSPGPRSECPARLGGAVAPLTCPREPERPLIARVIVLTPTRAVRGLFDYELSPALLARGVGVGSLLKVRFARRTLVAVVAELAASSELPAERLAMAEELLPARLPADLVGLALWLADEYCSTPARALEVVLPAGANRGVEERLVLVASLTAAGSAALHPAGGSEPPAAGTKPLTAGQRRALQTLADGPVRAAAVGTALLRRLEARGLVTLAPGPARDRQRHFEVSSVSATPPPLTTEQRAVLEALGPALGDGCGVGAGGAAELDAAPAFLLHGVTGSGKTEVYLRAAEVTLRQGRGVIILVPEIALTPQALARFRARFGDVVAVLHSGMSASRRYSEWLRLARGEAQVCVGARSAVFAPLADIGLIVVDEEHESSYKDERDPRYDARTVAARRARTHRALLLSGSATPRPEAVFGARRLLLRERVDGRPLPSVSVLDMRGLHHPLHPDARLALADCRHAGGKAIVLLNRRGWSNFLSCGSCGRVWMCPNCDVALVLHRSAGRVSCHHCGHQEQVPASCPDCGSVSVARHGAGTERLEHELAAALGGPDFPVFRLDADAAGIEARARILEHFQAARSGVLVGTQMVAKGHDFADVSLGVVIDADQTLRFPDFRAEERTFALVTQLAGRTGRGGGPGRAGSCPGAVGTGAGDDPGRVLVQTLQPAARPIVLAARHDAETFVRGELRRRKALGYPPFLTLVRVVCAAVEREAARRAALALAERIRADGGGAAGAVTVLGPAPLFTVRGRARHQLVAKADDRGAVIAAVRDAVLALSADRAHRQVALSVDVDPQ
ncbi:MAG: primosomal protein N' [Actinomycetota bacterium]|nr:primosomal protein N' [Actinomycetota bacterium]